MSHHRYQGGISVIHQKGNTVQPSIFAIIINVIRLPHPTYLYFYLLFLPLQATRQLLDRLKYMETQLPCLYR